MARLCVRIAPNEHPQAPADAPKERAEEIAAKNLLRTAPGDVVELVEDDHVFSYCETHNGQYRIIDVPGVRSEDLVHLKEYLENDENQMIKRRVRAVDHKADPVLPEIPKELAAAFEARDTALKIADAAMVAAELTAQDSAIAAKQAATLTAAALAEPDPDKLAAKLKEAEAAQTIADQAVEVSLTAKAAAEDATALADTLSTDPALVKHIGLSLAAIAAITIEKP